MSLNERNSSESGNTAVDKFLEKLATQLEIIDRRDIRVSEDIGDMKVTLKSLSERLNATSDKVIGCEKDVEYMQREIQKLRDEYSARIDFVSDYVNEKRLEVIREVSSIRVETEEKLNRLREETEKRMCDTASTSEKNVKLWVYGGLAVLGVTVITLIIKGASNGIKIH